MTRNRTWIAAGVVTSALFALAASSPAAADGDRHRGLLHIGITRTSVCDGTLDVAFNLETLRHRQWTTRLDDGLEVVEVHEVSGRSGPDGQWMPVASTSGGEGHLRWTGWGQLGTSGMHVDLIRVRRTDGARIASNPVVVSDSNCTP